MSTVSARRVMGIETEYGILTLGDPGANPMLMSAQVVSAYAAAVPQCRATWDYQDEDPLNDARGFRIERSAAHPSQLTDAPALGDAPPAFGGVTTRRRPVQDLRPALASNVILPNGARFYVDHAHPEYSGPEVTGPRDAVLWDRAGDEILLRASRLLAQWPGQAPVALYKNNTDGKGASYGTHENYLMNRDVPFADVVAALIPFLVTRPVFAGAGRVGLGQRGERSGFQISQRADFVEAEVGLETTLRRPIVNTRDEPHADPGRFRRLHVIVGDANLVQPATYLKTGTTALLLSLVERSVAEPGLLEPLRALAPAEPVTAAAAVSHDLTLAETLPLADGRALTALDIQREYARVLRAAAGPTPDPLTADVLDRWDDVLDRLGRDPGLCARDVEWVAKKRLLDGLRSRDGLDWDSPKLAALDLQWSDLRPEKGIYHRLEAAGAVDVLVTQDEVEAAVAHAPTDTRAYFRGEAVRRYGTAVAAANWDAIVLDVPGAEHLSRVPMPDPHRGTREHVGPLLDASPDADALLRALTGR